MGPRTYIRGKGKSITSRGWTLLLLQWGRGLTSAESDYGFVRWRLYPAWLQWGRGLTSAERHTSHARLAAWSASFNGAADLHPRKVAIGTNYYEENRGASMGPRTYIRGKEPTRRLMFSVGLLQWGRGLTSAESRRDHHDRQRDTVASMGPRTYIRGKQAMMECVAGHLLRASMGPRTYIRGKLAWSYDGDRENMASMGPRTYIRGKTAAPASLPGSPACFNGAADLHPRKARRAGLRPVGKSLASMGPRTYIRGKREPVWIEGHTVDLASMGPRTYIRGKCTWSG